LCTDGLGLEADILLAQCRGFGFGVFALLPANGGDFVLNILLPRFQMLTNGVEKQAAFFFRCDHGGSSSGLRVELRV
jgi:hypothetical protein